MGARAQVRDGGGGLDGSRWMLQQEAPRGSAMCGEPVASQGPGDALGQGQQHLLEDTHQPGMAGHHSCSGILRLSALLGYRADSGRS